MWASTGELGSGDFNENKQKEQNIILISVPLHDQVLKNHLRIEVEIWKE
jgi:hypothetical protein